MALRLSFLLICLLGISYVASAQSPNPLALLQQFPACAVSIHFPRDYPFQLNSP